MYEIYNRRLLIPLRPHYELASSAVKHFDPELILSQRTISTSAETTSQWKTAAAISAAAVALTGSGAFYYANNVDAMTPAEEGFVLTTTYLPPQRYMDEDLHEER